MNDLGGMMTQLASREKDPDAARKAFMARKSVKVSSDMHHADHSFYGGPFYGIHPEGSLLWDPFMRPILHGPSPLWVVVHARRITSLCRMSETGYLGH